MCTLGKATSKEESGQRGVSAVPDVLGLREGKSGSNSQCKKKEWS